MKYQQKLPKEVENEITPNQNIFMTEKKDGWRETILEAFNENTPDRIIDIVTQELASARQAALEVEAAISKWFEIVRTTNDHEFIRELRSILTKLKEKK